MVLGSLPDTFGVVARPLAASPPAPGRLRGGRRVSDRETGTDGRPGSATRAAREPRVRPPEVLRYIARGYTYKEVGGELGISVKTVETHVSAVLRKLQLSSRYELSRWAADHSIV
jgi:DNA-binding NarL/FixJ family response regulator